MNQAFMKKKKKKLYVFIAYSENVHAFFKLLKETRQLTAFERQSKY